MVIALKKIPLKKCTGLWKIFRASATVALLICYPTAKSAENTPNLHTNPGAAETKTEESESEALVEKASQAYANGDYQKALTIWQNLNDKWSTNPSPYSNRGISLRNIGIIHRSLGELPQSRRYLIEAASILEKTAGQNDPELATALSNLGITQDMLGEYKDAELSLKKALGIRENTIGKDHPYTATTIDALARVERNKGNYSASEALYLRSLNTREKSLGLAHPATAAAHSNIAQLYADQGRSDKAIEHFLKAEQVYSKANMLDHPDWGIIAISIGAFYERINDLEKSELYLRKGLNIIRSKLGGDHPYIGLAANNLSLVEKRLGRFQQALQYNEEALSLAASTYGQQHRNVAASMNNRGALYLALGDNDSAKTAYSEAFTIYRSALAEIHTETITAGLNYSITLAIAAEAQKFEDLALSLIRWESQLIQKEAPLLPSNDRRSFAYTLPAVKDVVISLSGFNNSGPRLALYATLNRQGLLEEIEKRQAQLASLPGAQQEAAQELRALTQQLASMSLSQEQRQSLKTRQEELEQQLYRLLPELKPRIVEVEQVAASLPANSALIEFQRYQLFDGRKPAHQRWGEARYLALVLKPDASITAVNLGPAAPIDDLIQQTLEAAEQKEPEAEDLLAQLGDKVMDPLSAATRGVNTLFISPDGELNRIPFAALPAPGSKQLLSEAVQLRLLTTGRELLDLQQPSAKAKAPPLVVANPAFDRSAVAAASGNGHNSADSAALTPNSESQQRSADLGSLRWNPLPGTAKEGQAIAALTQAQLLTQEQATAAAVQQQPAPKLLHIASHAFFLADQEQAKPAAGGLSRIGSAADGGALGGAAFKGENPLLRSGIALAGANNPPSSTGADDGYLTALEVAQLDWKGTELVVISACESGKGDILAGEGVYGLKRAIAVAGARSSLLSLWKVDDKATAAFMESFYSKLKAGTGRADALAATQREFRQSSNATWSHPYVWAAFQLSGDWGKVRW